MSGSRTAGAWDTINIKKDNDVHNYVPQKSKPPKPPKPPKRPTMSTLTATTPTNQTTIEDKWAGLTKSQIAQRKAQHDAAVTGYEQQRTLANTEYSGMRNQATTSRAMQERARKENMLNMGMSGGGGTSRTYQQRNTNNLNNQLGGISKQQQDFGNSIDFALGTAGSQFDADVMGITAQNIASASTEQMQYNQWKADAVARQREAKIRNAIDMLRAKMITKEQARAMTGLDL